MRSYQEPTIQAFAAFCLEQESMPRAVYKNSSQREAYQQRLMRHGFELEWAEDIKLSEGEPHVHAM